MKNNQFAIVPTDLATRKRELTQLRLLKDTDQSLSANDLWLTMLSRINPDAHTTAADQEWKNNLLATTDLSITQWAQASQPLTDDVFYLVALQLLHFEPALDFNIDQPLAAVKKINLPFESHETWDQDAVISAFYLLLNTSTKNGQSLLDRLTVDGLFTWTFDLPASQKPIFFNGKPLACFDSEQFIREAVYVETDMDTDNDGHADLVKVEITRPVESNQGLKVPVAFTASPYYQGTNDEWGEKITHHVNETIDRKEKNDVAPSEPHFNLNFDRQSVNGNADQATESFSYKPSYSLNDYLAARGYAVVISAGIGTKDSDGLQTCGSPEQVDSMKAVIEWLHGDRRAFTDRTSGIEIKADWCNGNVGMTGRSYLGTLSTAVATTGVPGLKAIVSEAAISNWYDYYRENGLVMAPGGFQGEDADVLAAETFSRTKRPADYRRIEKTNNEYMKGLLLAQDRKTGNYNSFWARRNYLPNVDQIKCDVMMVHGLNDWNVKPSNVKHLFDALQTVDVTKKLILHQGQHIYINAFQSLDFSAMVNLWFANKLWGVDNQADELLPDVLVQANDREQTWTAYHNWSGDHETVLNLTNNSLTSAAVHDQATVSYQDHQDDAVYKDWCKHPAKWSRALLNDEDGHFSAHFLTAPLKQDWLLRGMPLLKVQIAANVDHGILSARLVDRGSAKRLTVSPVILGKGTLQEAYHYGNDDLREFQFEHEASPYKTISYGHINLQNRHDASSVDDLKPGEFVDLKLPLQPVFHTLKAGHQLELILFGTDYGMTLRGNEAIRYQIDPYNSSLIIPDDQQ